MKRVTRNPICFDATGTLIELNEEVGEMYRRVALDHGVDLPAWRLEDAHRRVLKRAPARGVEGETIPSRRRAETDWWFERIRETFQATDSTARFEDFQSFAKALFETYRRPDAWRLRSGVVETLTWLRDQEWPMAIVSNFDHRLPNLLEGLDIAGYFLIISIPSESGSAKPARAVFEFVATTLACPVEALFYVGDDAKDVLEAIAEHGLRVFDIRDLENLEALPALVATAAILHHSSPG